MTTAEIFALNMKRQRCALKLTQAQLAERLSYSEKSISKWESGKAVAPSILLPKISEVLNMSIDEMFDIGDSPSYYLGIDGGGTKTEFLLVNRDGKEIKRIVSGASNPVDIGIDKTFAVLTKGINEVCEGIPFRKISVFAGIAGGITGNNKQLINSFLEKFSFCRFDNDSDAKNAVETALGGIDGIAVILGTGDIAFTKKNGKVYRTGGFGYLFDSGGSGYSIGRDGILAALEAEQKTGPSTLLLELFKKECGRDTLLESLSDFYEGGKRKIASFAPIVFEAHKQGDKVSEEILLNNFKSVAKLIKDASVYLDSEKITVYLTGSVAQSEFALKMINEGIKELNTKKEFNISVCDKPQVMGAVSLATKEE